MSAPAAAEEVRIGYQKYGTLVILKEKGLLEEKLEPLGFTVTWTEFPGGPQLLEALNVGAIDFGTTGEAPPIFAGAVPVGELKGYKEAFATVASRIRKHVLCQGAR